SDLFVSPLILFSFYFVVVVFFLFFFFNDTATTEIYTLSLHDALPIWVRREQRVAVISQGMTRIAITGLGCNPELAAEAGDGDARDRKSTRLNSSHLVISYAVFCLKKKKKKKIQTKKR